MMGEVDLYGVFVPTLGLLMVLAFLLSQPLRRGLEAWGLYLFVWHPPLFDVSLYVIVLGALVAAASRILP